MFPLKNRGKAWQYGAVEAKSPAGLNMDFNDSTYRALSENQTQNRLAMKPTAAPPPMCWRSSSSLLWSHTPDAAIHPTCLAVKTPEKGHFRLWHISLKPTGPPSRTEDMFTLENVKIPFSLNLPNKSSKLGNAPLKLNPLPTPANQFHTAMKLKWMTWTFTTNQTKSTNKLFEVSEIISEAPFALKRRKLSRLVWERLMPEVLCCCLCLFLLKMQPIKNSQMPHSLEIKVAPVNFRELGLYLHVDVSTELYVKNNKWCLAAPEWSFYNSFQAMWSLCWFWHFVCVCVCLNLLHSEDQNMYFTTKVRTCWLGLTEGRLR